MINKNINILIVSYNDIDINNTIESLISNSYSPENIKFKILLIDQDNINNIYKEYSRFNILNIKKNRGVGYSRKILTTNLPKNEYVLQIDSHHRFIKNWDKELIDNYLSLKLDNKNIILSSGLPPFDGEQTFDIFTVSKLDSYTINGIPKFTTIKGKPNLETGLICAHFIFTETSTFDYIKYNDLWYFFGEEILLSLLAYKNGFKVFSPNKIIAWHKYKSFDILRDLKVEKKTHKHIKNEIIKLYDVNFCKLIGIDYLNFRCSYRNYNLNNIEKFNKIILLTPNNKKIFIDNKNYNSFIRLSDYNIFIKGAILINTETNEKEYYSIITE